MGKNAIYCKLNFTRSSHSKCSFTFCSKTALLGVEFATAGTIISTVVLLAAAEVFNKPHALGSMFKVTVSVEPSESVSCDNLSKVTYAFAAATPVTWSRYVCKVPIPDVPLSNDPRSVVLPAATSVSPSLVFVADAATKLLSYTYATGEGVVSPPSSFKPVKSSSAKAALLYTFSSSTSSPVECNFSNAVFV